MIKLRAQQAAAWCAYIGAISLGLLVIAAVTLPLGSYVVDYWKPMVVAHKAAPTGAPPPRR